MKTKIETGGVKVMTCTCAHAYQDAKYGKHLRVHNRIVKPSPGWRCTVCKTTRNA